MKTNKTLVDTHPCLSKQWHPTKNGDLKPTDVTYGSNIRVWWQLPYDDPKTGKHFDFDWKVSIDNRTDGKSKGCPYLSGAKAWRGFNDLETLRPELASQWHPIKNKNLFSHMVTPGSNKKVWWVLPYDDPLDGKHYDLEWDAFVYKRSAGEGCPYLVGKRVLKGFNDLETKAPNLAKEWHPIKNGSLKSSNVTYGSGRNVWWLLPYDDPNTGKHFDFEWEASIEKRFNGNGCPFLNGKKIYKGFNDLATINPELAAQWHPTKNHGLNPSDVFANSNKKYYWIFPYDDPKTGKHFDFVWDASPSSRLKTSGCPYLTGKRVWIGFNDLKTISPDLVAQWNYEKNGNLKPENFMPNSKDRVWWKYSYYDSETGKDFTFEWPAKIGNRYNSQGCPFLSGNLVWKGFNDLASCNKELSFEWNHLKNRNLKPEMVTPKSNKKVWWKCPSCGKTWRCEISKRTEGQQCECNGKESKQDKNSCK